MLRAYILHRRTRGLPLIHARNFVSTSNRAKERRGRPRKLSSDTPKHAPDIVAPTTPCEVEGPQLAASLSQYSRLPPLPPIGDWLSHFPSSPLVVRDRISIRDPASAIRVAHSFITSKKTSTGKPKVIIEAYPGPGALSRALLTLPPSQLQRLIILEDYEPYLEYLRPLALADPRVRVVPQSGFSWDTYSHLLETGDLDVDIAPWNTLHPELHFVSHVPLTTHGEQFVAQLFRSIPEKSWLFKYGRVPMSFILLDWVWRRFSAPPKGADRCKLGVTAEATSQFSHSLPPEKLSPYLDHFHPALLFGHDTGRPENKRRGNPFLAVNVLPHAEQVIDKGKMDQWDYILRRLFTCKSTPLSKAIGLLAPGAEVLLDVLTDKELPPEQRVDIRLKINHLTLSDWGLIVRAFDAWPFAPEELNIDGFINYKRDQE